MIFNSLEFVVFFVIVYALYLVLTLRWQNRMLLIASLIFYGAWDWRFLSLVFLTTVIDYYCGVRIADAATKEEKKKYLFFSIVSNLGILGFFKYFNFFAGNMQSLLAWFGVHADMQLLNIILPVGISFYTFQSMSYTIDVYRNDMEPSRSYPNFLLFVAFFPQLVAGPIERARELYPQMVRERSVTLDKVSEGCYLVLWGYFQKVFIADNLAPIVNGVFNEPGPYNTFSVLLGVYGFAYQIFCDFAGYSNIARGVAKMMGIDLMVNFNLPYFSKNPSEFWQRWHISLSSWLRDYLYVPLGGNRKGSAKTYRNLVLTMLLGGLWHGAAWTFIFWGAYQGILLVVHRLIKEPIARATSSIRGWKSDAWTVINIVFFFHLVCIGWLFFRAQSLEQVGAMAAGLLNFDAAALGALSGEYAKFFLLVTPLLIIQFFQYIWDDLYVVFKTHWAFQGVVYFALVFCIFVFGAGGSAEFIYFQF